MSDTQSDPEQHVTTRADDHEAADGPGVANPRRVRWQATEAA